jgi:hypothetical protein
MTALPERRVARLRRSTQLTVSKTRQRLPAVRESGTHRNDRRQSRIGFGAHLMRAALLYRRRSGLDPAPNSPSTLHLRTRAGHLSSVGEHVSRRLQAHHPRRRDYPSLVNSVDADGAESILGLHCRIAESFE